MQEASNTIDKAGVRSRVIERKLRTVQELPKEEAIELLGDSIDDNTLDSKDIIENEENEEI